MIACVHWAMWLFVTMFWNGNQIASELGSLLAEARSGKNAVIQICGRSTPTRRTPKLRLLDVVTQNIFSLLAPNVCANGAHRPHELVSPVPWFAIVSGIAGV